MRRKQNLQRGMWSYVSDEDRIPVDHPLRAIRAIVDPILLELSPQFDALYQAGGRASVPPEYLLRALLLQMLYSVRSERQLVEQLNYNILFRWFVGLSMDDEPWHATTFTKNRQRLIDGDIARIFFARVVAHAMAKSLMSSEHFTVDGTMIEASASQKSLVRRDTDDPPDAPTDGGRNPSIDFHGETRSNATHVSTTDPDARLYRKSANTAAKLSYLGHVMTENRNGLIVNARLTSANGYGERAAAIGMVAALSTTQRVTLAADKGYDSAGFVAMLEEFNVVPHIARHTKRRSAISATIFADPGYAISQQRRKLVEESFGWMKSIALMRKLRHRGHAKVSWIFTMTATAYNLIRIAKMTTVMAA